MPQPTSKAFAFRWNTASMKVPMPPCRLPQAKPCMRKNVSSAMEKLASQMTDIRDGKRRNANPDMVKIIKKYDNQQLIAISAYQSSMVMPGAMCKPKAAKKK